MSLNSVSEPDSDPSLIPSCTAGIESPAALWARLAHLHTSLQDSIHASEQMMMQQACYNYNNNSASQTVKKSSSSANNVNLIDHDDDETGGGNNGMQQPLVTNSVTVGPLPKKQNKKNSNSKNVQQQQQDDAEKQQPQQLKPVATALDLWNVPSVSQLHDILTPWFPGVQQLPAKFMQQLVQDAADFADLCLVQRLSASSGGTGNHSSNSSGSMLPGGAVNASSPVAAWPSASSISSSSSSSTSASVAFPSASSPPPSPAAGAKMAAAPTTQGIIWSLRYPLPPVNSTLHGATNRKAVFNQFHSWLESYLPDDVLRERGAPKRRSRDQQQQQQGNGRGNDGEAHSSTPSGSGGNNNNNSSSSNGSYGDGVDALFSCGTSFSCGGGMMMLSSPLLMSSSTSSSSAVAGQVSVDKNGSFVGVAVDAASGMRVSARILEQEARERKKQAAIERKRRRQKGYFPTVGDSYHSPVSFSNNNSGMGQSSGLSGNDDSNVGEVTNMVVLAGGVGAGTTSMTFQLAKSFGVRVVEVNTSLRRNGASLEKFVSEATQSRGIATSGANTTTGSAQLEKLVFSEDFFKKKEEVKGEEPAAATATAAADNATAAADAAAAAAKAPPPKKPGITKADIMSFFAPRPKPKPVPKPVVTVDSASPSPPVNVDEESPKNKKPNGTATKTTKEGGQQQKQQQQEGEEEKQEDKKLGKDAAVDTKKKASSSSSSPAAPAAKGKKPSVKSKQAAEEIVVEPSPPVVSPAPAAAPKTSGKKAGGKAAVATAPAPPAPAPKPKPKPKGRKKKVQESSSSSSGSSDSDDSSSDSSSSSSDEFSRDSNENSLDPSGKGLHALILIESGDAVASDEGGFYSALKNIAKETQCPIIVTAGEAAAENVALTLGVPMSTIQPAVFAHFNESAVRGVVQSVFCFCILSCEVELVRRRFSNNSSSSSSSSSARCGIPRDQTQSVLGALADWLLRREGESSGTAALVECSSPLDMRRMINALQWVTLPALSTRNILSDRNLLLGKQADHHSQQQQQQQQVDVEALCNGVCDKLCGVLAHSMFSRTGGISSLPNTPAGKKTSLKPSPSRTSRIRHQPPPAPPSSLIGSDDPPLQTDGARMQQKQEAEEELYCSKLLDLGATSDRFGAAHHRATILEKAFLEQQPAAARQAGGASSSSQRQRITAEMTVRFGNQRNTHWAKPYSVRDKETVFEIATYLPLTKKIKP